MGSKAQTIGGQGELAYIAEPLRPLALPIADLHPDPANARTHDERNIQAIVASLARFGQRLPIVVQKQGMIVRAGNGRLAAAKSLGWSHLACVVVDEASVDATAYAIADNRTAELAGWDDETLASLLQSLPDDARLAAGFDDGELKELLDGLTPPEVVEDESPAPLPTPVSKTGDLWVMGGHRLLCGDCTKEGDVGLVVVGDVGCVLTDPPYGQDQAGVPNDEAAKHSPLIQMAVQAMPLACGVCVAFASPRTFPVWLDAVRNAGHVFERMLWLYKEAQCSYPWRGWLLKSEAILVSSIGTSPAWMDAHPYTHDCYKVTAVQGELDDGQWHGSVKPIAVVADLMNRIGGTVYEPFSGSGTTIVAAEQLGRRCFAIEIEPLYVDVAVRRWQKLTGKEAVHEATGKTWRETAAERGVNVE